MNNCHAGCGGVATSDFLDTTSTPLPNAVLPTFVATADVHNSDSVILRAHKHHHNRLAGGLPSAGKQSALTPVGAGQGILLARDATDMSDQGGRTSPSRNSTISSSDFQISSFHTLPSHAYSAMSVWGRGCCSCFPPPLPAQLPALTHSSSTHPLFFHHRWKQESCGYHKRFHSSSFQHGSKSGIVYRWRRSFGSGRRERGWVH